MKSIPSPSRLLGALSFSFFLFGCESVPNPNLPTTTAEGLVLKQDGKADAVYVRPGVDLSGYTKIALLDPEIAFMADWLGKANSGNMGLNRVSKEDMQGMIAEGKTMLTEEFTEVLTKGGYTLVTTAGPDVLAVRASIVDLDAKAPDPNGNGGAWVKTYSDGAGSATMVVELYDSVSHQLLVRAYDHKSDANGGTSWAVAQSSGTNRATARYAFNDWAQMLRKGLDLAKAAPAAPKAP